MKREETVVKIAARMQDKAEEEAIKKYLKDDKAAEEKAKIIQEMEEADEEADKEDVKAVKEVAKAAKEQEKAAGQFDFKNFDSKSFASWAKSSSTPSPDDENTNGRLKTF